MIKRRMGIYIYIYNWKKLNKTSFGYYKFISAGHFIREMDMATRVHILDENDCILHSTNTLGKGINPIILPPAMSKIVGQTEIFSLGEATSLGEGIL